MAYHPLPDSLEIRLEKLLVGWRRFYSAYHTLIYLAIISAMAELAYGIINQSAIPPYIEAIHLTAYLGVVYATFLVVETVFKSPLGHLGDRLGRRPLIAGGALLSAAAALLLSFSSTLWIILVLRALDGIAAAAIWPTMIAAIGGSVGKERRTTAMSVLTVTYIAGLALGPLLGGLANDITQSKRTSFWLVSVLFLITAAIAYFLIPHRSKEEMEAGGGIEESKPSLSDIAQGIRTVPDMMLLAFTAFFAIGLLVPIVKLFAMHELGMSETGYGLLVLPIAVAVATASAFSGILGDRWGKARSVRLGLGITAVAMWAVTVSDLSWQFAVAGMFLGIGFVLAMPAWLALVSDMAAPRMRGVVIGALGTAQGIGAVVGAYLGPAMYVHLHIRLFGIAFNPHYSPFVVSALLLIVCLILAVVFVRDDDGRRIGAKEYAEPL